MAPLLSTARNATGDYLTYLAPSEVSIYTEKFSKISIKHCVEMNFHSTDSAYSCHITPNIEYSIQQCTGK